MAGVPYIFGNATTSIPLTNLDANFNTGVTIGNTTVGLGNTVTTLGNVTIANATTISAAGNVFLATSSGSVGIGTTTPANKFQVVSAGQTVGAFSSNNSSTDLTNAGALIAIQNTNATAGNMESICFNDSTNNTTSAITGVNTSHTTHEGYMIFNTVNSGGTYAEKMRIDSSGNLLVGTTTQQYLAGKIVSYASGNYNALFASTDTAGYQCITYWNRATSNTRYYCQFDQGASHTTTGYIYTSDGTSTTYATTSDQRLKENIVDAGSGLEKIANVKIRSFDWISTKNKVDFGVIAQELYKVAPECVGVGEDNSDGTIDKPWSVDISFLVPALIKSVQELNAKVDAQSATIAELQAKVGV